MKLVTLTLGILLSSTALAQSFVLQTNGTLLSVDTLGNIYDLRQSVTHTNVLAKGKNWILEKNQMLTTIDTKGFVYKKTNPPMPRTLKASGGSYFVSSTGQLAVVNSAGLVFTYDNVTPVKTGEITVTGGNYLVAKNGATNTLITIDTVKGFAYTIAPAVLTSLGLNLANIREKGGNYFVDTTGTLFTVDKNGTISSKKSMGTFTGLKTRGSNFLVDSFGGVRVVLNSGWLLMPTLPANMGAIVKAGSTYVWDGDDDFFIFAESAPDAEVTSTNANVFASMLAKLITTPMDQVDSRMVVP